MDEQNTSWQGVLPERAQERVEALRATLGERFGSPGAMDAYTFLVSEVGELGDALLRSGYGTQLYPVRRQPTARLVADELGDVLFMLATLASVIGCRLEDCLSDTLTKIEERCKGRP